MVSSFGVNTSSPHTLEEYPHRGGISTGKAEAHQLCECEASQVYMGELKASLSYTVRLILPSIKQ